MWGQQPGIDDRNLERLADLGAAWRMGYHLAMGTTYMALGIVALADPIPGDEYVFFAKGVMHYSSALGKKATSNWAYDQMALRATAGTKIKAGGIYEFTC